jgi:putative CocE/NonD family hydrolase
MKDTENEVVHVRELTTKMVDGVRLVADAWHPKQSGPWPVLLQRLPYGRASASTPVLPHPEWFARHGYAVVVQDVRGCGDSEGVFEPFVNEGADGAATIKWAAHLPFSNGDVATYGFSYQGLAQLYAAALQPQPLRAIAPMMCCPDPYEGWTYQGGCLRWAFVAEWAAQLASLQNPGAPIAPDLTARPLADALGPNPPTWFRDWLAHRDDDNYWALRRPRLDRIKVPAFTVLGWFDDFALGTARLIDLLDAEAVCGPWAHIPWGTRLGDFEFGDEAAGRLAATELLGFFNRVLKRANDRPDGRVRYFAPGSGWSDSKSWPPNTERQRLTAVSAGDANSRHGTGRLTREAAQKGPPDLIVVDTRDAYPAAPPLTSEAANEDRTDVLSYTAAPLNSHLTLAGLPSVLARVGADRQRHKLVAALLVVDASGEPRCISVGAALVNHPVPGQPSEVRVQLSPISWTLKAGTRLRLDISGDRFPYVASLVEPTSSGGGALTTVTLFDVALDLPVVSPSVGS